MNRVFCIAVLFAFGCNNNTAKTTDQSLATDAVANRAEIAGCYQMNIEKDSAFIQLMDSTGLVSGKLNYRRFEKDNNSGYFTGTVTPKNHLEGWYRFMSEGMISVRQVIFKIGDQRLIEGYGDMDIRNDTAYFKYPSNLRYEEKHPFIKSVCNDRDSL